MGQSPVRRLCTRLPRVAERLDEERLEILRTWGAGLSASGRDELRAAGKAIVMLIDEIDRLQADVWMAGEAAVQRARLEAAVAVAQPRQEPEPEPEPEEAPPDPRISVDGSEALALTLSERIARGRAPAEPA
jgi:hypothetical protein